MFGVLCLLFVIWNWLHVFGVDLVVAWCYGSLAWFRSLLFTVFDCGFGFTVYFALFGV